MSELPDLWFPEFNKSHTLRPSGDEPMDERWTAWNDLDFDFYDYQKDYFFWLGSPENAYLTDRLGDREYLISWSTCMYFRAMTRMIKGKGELMPPKNLCPQTLRYVTEVGYGRYHEDNPAIKVVNDDRDLWEPPAQIFLRAPEEPPPEPGPGSFPSKLKRYREQKKSAKYDKARSSRPRIARRR